MKIIKKIASAILINLIIFNIILSTADSVSFSVQATDDLAHNYKVLEIYDMEFSHVVEIELQYDKYKMYQNYVVNISSSKRSVYPDAEPDTKRHDRMAYGEKFPVYQKIENDEGDEFYIVKSKVDGEYKYGYIHVDDVSLREFQIDKMVEKLDFLTESVTNNPVVYVENYKNENGSAPRLNGKSSDEYGNRRGQAAAGYYDSTLDGDFRYVPDGMLCIAQQMVTTTDIDTYPYIVLPDGSFAERDLENAYSKVPSKYDDVDDMRDELIEDFEKEKPFAINVNVPDYGESLWIKGKYLDNENPFEELTQCIIVDRKNQNIAVFEKDEDWKIISLSYSSTGKTGQFSIPTPLGLFMAIEEKKKFNYVQDGTDTIVGFAPYAIRFTAGGYLHGVPMNYHIDGNGARTAPTTYKESLGSLGTIPKSHMCVRNFTSHALFMYEWVDIGNCAVIVME